MFFNYLSCKTEKHPLNTLANRNKQLKKQYTLIVILVLSITCFSQNKTFKFYDEHGIEISRQQFYQKKLNNNFYPLYFEKDTISIGVLNYREIYGVLNDTTFQQLKAYLNSFKNTQIHPEDIIVINYLTGVPENEQNKKSRTSWNIFDGNYVKQLKKIANISHFWIASLDRSKLNYFYGKQVDWKKDTENVIPRLFFPYEITYGYYIIIKPDGHYYYSIGEYTKNIVWKKTEEMSH